VLDCHENGQDRYYSGNTKPLVRFLTSANDQYFSGDERGKLRIGASAFLRGL